MHYYQHHVGDYNRDTATLSIVEHGAYRLLMDAYYVAERPLPAELEALCRICRAMSKSGREAVRRVKERYFREEEGVLRHKRIDAEITEYQGKADQASQAGKRSGEVRRAKREQSLERDRERLRNGSMNDRSNASLFPRSTNREPATSNHLLVVEEKAAAEEERAHGATADFLEGEPGLNPEPAGIAYPEERRSAHRGSCALDEALAYAESFSRGNALGQSITPEQVDSWHDDRCKVGWVFVKSGVELPIADWKADLRSYAKSWEVNHRTRPRPAAASAGVTTKSPSPSSSTQPAPAPVNRMPASPPKESVWSLKEQMKLIEEAMASLKGFYSYKDLTPPKKERYDKLREHLETLKDKLMGLPG